MVLESASDPRSLPSVLMRWRLAGAPLSLMSHRASSERRDGARPLASLMAGAWSVAGVSDFLKGGSGLAIAGGSVRRMALKLRRASMAEGSGFEGEAKRI
jgi:hypothetical protein